MTHDVDVVVVGAGLAGLRVADRLLTAGRSVRVFEARDRVGGRTHTVVVDGTVIDHGGQWIGPAQQRVVALAEDLGLQLYESGIEFPLDRSGRYSYEIEGRLTRLPDMDALPIADEQRQQVESAVAELERLTATVDVQAPWLTTDAVDWDGVTVESWLRDHIPDEVARKVFRSLTLMDIAADASEMSMLALMFDGATYSLDEAPEKWRITGGAQLLCDGLARRAEECLRLHAPVRAIRWDADHAEVRTDEDWVRTRRVVVALPPQLAGRLVYDPAMPAERDGLTSRYPSTSVIKCHAVYERPFWRDAGLNGWAVLPDDGVLDVMGDNSPEDGRRGVLVGFIQRRNATHWGSVPEEERRAAVLATFARILGDAALEPLGYTEANWAADPYARGCFQCQPTPHAWVSFGRAWRAPVGPIHWAASEYSSEWYGFMEGALASADAVADELLGELPS